MAGIITNRPWQGGARERSCPPVRLSGRATLRRPDGPPMAEWPLTPAPGDGYWPEALVARHNAPRARVGSQPLLLVEDMPPSTYVLSFSSSVSPSPGIPGEQYGNKPLSGYTLAPVVVRVEFSLPGGETQALEVDPDCEVSVIASSVRVTCAWEQVRGPADPDSLTNPAPDIDYIPVPLAPSEVSVSCMLVESERTVPLAPRSIWHPFGSWEAEYEPKNRDWGLVPPGAVDLAFEVLQVHNLSGSALWYGNFLAYSLGYYAPVQEAGYPAFSPYPVRGPERRISYSLMSNQKQVGAQSAMSAAFELGPARTWQAYRLHTDQLGRQSQIEPWRAVYYVR